MAVWIFKSGHMQTFKTADFESEIKIMKWKLADPVWRTQYTENEPSHFKMGTRGFQSRSYIAQNIAERCHIYLQYFIAIEILSQDFCQILQNVSSQHYNFKFLKCFWQK